MFAVIESNKNQLKVSEGKKYKIDLLEGVIKENEEIKFSDVLLVDNGENVTIGEPKIEGAHVTAKFLGVVREKKVVIKKFHAKKRYSRTAGERPEKMLIEILKISVSAAPKKDGPVSKKLSSIKNDEK